MSRIGWAASLVVVAMGCGGGSRRVPDEADPDAGDAGEPDGDEDGTPDADDCDDEDPLVHPGAPEVCNGLDDDCDRAADEDAEDAATWFEDLDGDGFGAEASAHVACDAQAGWVEDAGDCDDADPARFPTAPETCDSIDQDCDGDLSEGTCAFDHASSACDEGVCALGACDAGFDDCNLEVDDGCEIESSGWSNTDLDPEHLGSFDADSASGFACPASECVGPAAMRTGRQGRFFTVEAVEASSCCAYVSIEFRLTVPEGVDYDLYVGGEGCSTDPDTSSSTTDGNETVTVWCDDSCGGDASDESFTATAEVRWVEGSSCTSWTLELYRRGC